MSSPPPALFHPRRHFSKWVKFGLPLLTLFLLWLLWYEVPLLFTSLVISCGLYYLLNPLVDLLETYSLRRAAASILVLIGFLGLMYLLWLRVMDFSTDLRANLDLNVFQKNLISKVDTSLKWAQEKAPILKRFIEPEQKINQPPPKVSPAKKSKKNEPASLATTETPKPATLSEKIETFVEKQILYWAPSVAVKLASVLPNVFLNLLLIPYFTFFMLKDGRTFKKILIKWIPNRYFEPALKFFYEMGCRIRRYLQNLLLDCSLVGLLVGFGSALIGIPYAVVFGIIAFFLNTIPLLGPLAYGAICLIFTIGAGESSDMILGFLGIFLISRICDDLVLVPLIYGKSHHIHPMLVVCAVLIGGTIAGVWGMFLAVPILSTLFLGMNIVREISVGEETITLPPSAFPPFA